MNHFPSLLDAFIQELVDKIAAELRQAPPIKRWPELMDIDTAAEYMSRTPDGLRALIKKKMLPVTKIDARIQLRRADIDRLIEQCTT